MKKIYTCILLFALSASIFAQNRPYIDDKLVHFGFSLGINMMDFATPASLDTIDGEIWHARQSSLIPGFSVGFITDVRISRHLNLRVTPTLDFGVHTISYKTESRNGGTKKTDVLAMPITLPILLKWSAEREVNYRPYLVGGGGISYDFALDKKSPILQRPLDFFVEVGVGCDFYFEWFKLCPQLTFRMGFMDVLTPIEQRTGLEPDKFFYTNALDRLLNRQLTLTFNFE